MLYIYPSKASCDGHSLNLLTSDNWATENACLPFNKACILEVEGLEHLIIVGEVTELDDYILDPRAKSDFPMWLMLPVYDKPYYPTWLNSGMKSSPAIWMRTVVEDVAEGFIDLNCWFTGTFNIVSDKRLQEEIDDPEASDIPLHNSICNEWANQFEEPTTVLFTLDKDKEREKQVELFPLGRRPMTQQEIHLNELYRKEETLLEKLNLFCRGRALREFTHLRYFFAEYDRLSQEDWEIAYKMISFYKDII